MFILDFLKSLTGYIDRSTIEEDLRLTISELENITIPVFNSATSQFTNNFKSKEVEEIIRTFKNEYSPSKGVKQINFIAEINYRLNSILENIKFIDKEVDKVLEAHIVTDDLSVKKIILVRAVDQVNFLVKYTMDLLTYVIIHETLAAGAKLSDAFELTPLAVKNIKVNMSTYFNNLAAYGIPNEEFVKKFNSLPAVKINRSTSDAVLNAFEQSKLDPFKSGPISNFSWSPIYHLNIAIAEFQANRVKLAQDKKRELEMRLLLLNEQRANNSNPAIEKEIIYIQNRVEKLEAKIHDLSN